MRDFVDLYWLTLLRGNQNNGDYQPVAPSLSQTHYIMIHPLLECRHDSCWVNARGWPTTSHPSPNSLTLHSSLLYWSVDTWTNAASLPHLLPPPPLFSPAPQLVVALFMSILTGIFPPYDKRRPTIKAPVTSRTDCTISAHCCDQRVAFPRSRGHLMSDTAP